MPALHAPLPGVAPYCTLDTTPLLASYLTSTLSPVRFLTGMTHCHLCIMPAYRYLVIIPARRGATPASAAARPAGRSRACRVATSATCARVGSMLRNAWWPQASCSECSHSMCDSWPQARATVVSVAIVSRAIVSRAIVSMTGGHRKNDAPPILTTHYVPTSY